MKSRFVIRLLAAMVVDYSCQDSMAQKNDWQKEGLKGRVKITCINPRDTVSEKVKIINTFFLIESLDDTIKNISITSSCGCEIPEWKKDIKIYPNHPDTVIITSQLTGHVGRWKKSSTIYFNNYQQPFYTEFIVTK